jgi:hypothetical protein
MGKHGRGTSSLKVQALKRDAHVARKLGRDKIAGLWNLKSMYFPSSRPVGKALKVRSGHECSPTVIGVKVLDSRSIKTSGDTLKDVPPLYVFKLRPGELITDGRSFKGIIDSQHQVIREISVDFRFKTDDMPALLRLQRYPKTVAVGDAVSLLTGGAGSVNYFHWLYDVLPRLYLLERAGFANSRHIIVPRLDQSFKEDTLTLLGVDLRSCLEVKGPVRIQADSLAASSGHRNYLHVEPWIPSFLRERLVIDEPSRSGLRLYINRRDTSIRTLLNEDELESALVAEGFESVTMANYSFAEKVALYSAAEVIVAPHGSGLSNIAFCSPGTKIVDVTGDEWYWPVFRDVALALGLNYRTVAASTAMGSGLLPNKVRHLHVDIDTLLRALHNL